MSKATRKSSTKQAEKISPDHALIAGCVNYAQLAAAAEAGFKADPDGNNAYAAAASKRPRDKADRLLVALTTTKAATASGLNAKARIVPIILHGDGYEDGALAGSTSDISAAFYLSFANEVREFTGKIVDEEWKAEIQAERLRAASAKGGAS